MCEGSKGNPLFFRGITMSTVIEYNVTSDPNRKIFGPNYTLPSPSYVTTDYGNIRFDDSSDYVSYESLFLVDTQNEFNPSSFNPVLAIDQGLWVEKSVKTYGVLSTRSDPAKGSGGGAIMLGMGLESSEDYSKIVLTDASFPELYIYQSDNSLGGIEANLLDVNNLVLVGRSSDPSSASPGQIWYRNNL